MLSPPALLAGTIAGVALLACLGLARAQDFSTLGDEFHGSAVDQTHAEPPRPPDPPAPPFGTRGEWIITSSSSLGIFGTTYDGSQARFFSVAVSPGVDWFFAPNVSAGISLNGQYAFSEGYGADGSLVASNSTTMSGGVRLGYSLPLGTRFSLYPLLTLGFEWVHYSEILVAGTSLSTAGAPLGYPSTTEFGPWMQVYVPVLWHIASHAFVGLGPWLFHEFGPAEGGANVGGERTGGGASFIVGGWSGGPDVAKGVHPEAVHPEEASAAPDAARTRRFGEAREVVLTGGFVASLGYTSYSGSPSSSFVATVAPGVDYFLVDRVTVGVVAQISYSSVTGIDPAAPAGSPPSQSVITNVYKSIGVGPRVSVDFPLGPMLSLDPSVYILFGADSYDETSATSANSYTESFITGGLYVPLLLHATQHLFAGFGPSASHDLSRIVTESGQPNRATTLGAGLVVGVWM